jgi:hypothetical protein
MMGRLGTSTISNGTANKPATGDLRREEELRKAAVEEGDTSL